MDSQKPAQFLTIGQTAKRAGVNASTLRFYESRGLIESLRTDGNQRRYERATLRRIAVIQVAQALGLTLTEIGQALAALPNGRTPTRKDWERLSSRWREQLDERIRILQKVRDNLSGCIGCGCLSLRRCALYNPKDQAATRGPGPVLLTQR
ncbi:MAG: redox-sensitive transcriptional activator SoxR [Gammaproteobacteria bacterium]|nr:redox-sensitive transcriptional activator SoxR [Gammaproteobacteria bacterium]